MTESGPPDPDEMLRAMLDAAGGGGQAERELTSALDRLLADPGADRLAWARQHGQGTAAKDRPGVDEPAGQAL